MAGTGYRPGRPVSPEPKVRRLVRDAAVEVAARMVHLAKLGDPAAAAIVLNLALSFPGAAQEAPK